MKALVHVGNSRWINIYHLSAVTANEDGYTFLLQTGDRIFVPTESLTSEALELLTPADR